MAAETPLAVELCADSDALQRQWPNIAARVRSAAAIVEAVERIDSVVRARIKELEAKHGTLASCGGYEGMEYSYDMEAAAALNELHQIAALAAAGRPHAEK